MEDFTFLIQLEENNSQDMLEMKKKMENMTQRNIEKEFLDATSIKL